jgi:uncharacterized membrane protein
MMMFVQNKPRGFMRFIEGTGAILPVLYLAWALPFVVILVWTVPPWSNPDEPQHMLRVVELANGELLGHRDGPHDAGGISNAAVYDAARPLEEIKHHPERKVSVSILKSSEDIGWRKTPEFTDFSGAAPYPPFLYAPAILADVVSEHVGLSVDGSLRLARLVTAIMAVFLSTLAIALAGRTKYVLAALSVLPMTCSLYASVGQDAMMIALTFLAVAWIDRIICANRVVSRGELAGLSVMLMLVALGRPPYVAFALLPLLVPGRRWAGRVAACLAIVAGVVLWSVIAGLTVLVPQNLGDPHLQILYLAAKPWRVLHVVTGTFQYGWLEFLNEFIGKLGWLDISLPAWYVLLALDVLIFAFVAAARGPGRWPWIPAVCYAGAVLLVLAAEYLSWAPPGSALAYGVQGRYFIPAAAVLGLGVPALEGIGALAEPVAVLGIVVLGAVTPAVTVYALAMRYYLGP